MHRAMQVDSDGHIEYHSPRTYNIIQQAFTMIVSIIVDTEIGAITSLFSCQTNACTMTGGQTV